MKLSDMYYTEYFEKIEMTHEKSDKGEQLYRNAL